MCLNNAGIQVMRNQIALAPSPDCHELAGRDDDRFALAQVYCHAVFPHISLHVMITQCHSRSSEKYCC